MVDFGIQISDLKLSKLLKYLLDRETWSSSLHLTTIISLAKMKRKVATAELDSSRIDKATAKIKRELFPSETSTASSVERDSSPDSVVDWHYDSDADLDD